MCDTVNLVLYQSAQGLFCTATQQQRLTPAVPARYVEICREKTRLLVQHLLIVSFSVRLRSWGIQCIVVK